MAIKLGDEKSLSDGAVSARDFLLNKTRRTVKQKITLGDHEIELVIVARSTKELQKLLEEHPPRKNEPLDNIGFNRSTFPPSLFAASVSEPKLDEDEWNSVWTDSNYSAGEHGHLLDLVFDVSNKGFDVPFGGRG